MINGETLFFRVCSITLWARVLFVKRHPDRYCLCGTEIITKRLCTFTSYGCLFDISPIKYPMRIPVFINNVLKSLAAFGLTCVFRVVLTAT